MSVRGPRVCLVCRSATSAAHLGMDLCRACSVFYKRSIGRERFECRAAGNCEMTNVGRSCRACRLVLIEKLIKESTDTPSPPEHHDDSSYSEKDEEERLLDEPCGSVESSEGSECSASALPPLLERLELSYRAMSYTRMSAELHAREDPPHPLEFDLEKPPLFPTTYCTINRGNRVLLSTALEFASATFPKFDKLSKQMKWKLVLNFFYRFRYFEGCVRANKYLPDHPDRVLLCYTSWISMDDLEYFFSDCPHGDVDGAIKYMSTRNVQGISISTCREIVARLDPSEEEFLLITALFFWSIDGISDCEPEVVELASYYRKKIHKEMHAYYRDELDLDQYASRMGELVSYVTVFDVSEHVKQHYEMFRLFGLFKDDSFTYQLKEL